MYNSDILLYSEVIQFPFIINVEQKYGLCNCDNSIILNGYGFDESTEIKINEKPVSNVQYIHSANSFILTIPSENMPKKYNIKATSNDGERTSNQISYFTIPSLFK